VNLDLQVINEAGDSEADFDAFSPVDLQAVPAYTHSPIAQRSGRLNLSPPKPKLQRRAPADAHGSPGPRNSRASPARPDLAVKR